MVGLDLQTAKELKFIREQTQHCAGDLGALRRELTILRTQQEDLGRELASVAGTVWEREKRLELGNYGAEQGTKEIKAWESKVVGLERELQGQKACHTKVVGLEKELQGQGSQLDVLRQLVRDIGPDAQPSVRELRAVLKYDLHQDVDRKLSLQKVALDREREATCSGLEARIASLAEKVGQVQVSLETSRKSAQAALDERLCRLEAEIMGQVGREMEALNKVSREMTVCNSEVHRLKEAVGSADGARGFLGQQSALLREPLSPAALGLGSPGLSPGARTQAPNVCERLDQLERSLAESERKHSMDLEVSRRDLQRLESTHYLDLAQQSSMAAQLANLEKICQDFTEMHSKEAETSRERFDQMRGTLAQHQTQLAVLDDVNRRAGALAVSEGRLSAELATTGARLEQQLVRLAALEGQGKAVTELREAVASSQEERRASEAQQSGRIDRLEERLGEVMGKQTAESEALKTSYSRQMKEFEADVGARSGAAIERVDALEKKLASSAQSREEDMAYARSQLEQLQTRLAAQEAQKPTVSDLKLGQSAVLKEVAELHAQQASLTQRLGSLEGSVAGAVSKTTADAEALRAAHAVHAKDLEAAKAELGRCGALPERFAELERRLGELRSWHAEEQQEAYARLEQLSGRLSASEVHSSAVEELRKSHSSSVREQATLQSQHAAAHQRLDRLEALLASQAEQQTASAKAIADAHAKSHGELKDKHAEDLGAAISRLDHLQGRLTACEQQGPSIAYLKEAVGGLRDERAARDAHQYTVLERMDRLESMFSDTMSRQTAESESLRALQANSSKELEASTLARHAAVAERMDSLERGLGGSVDKNRQELSAAAARLEQLQGRVSACEAQAAAAKEAAHAAAAKEAAALRSQQEELAEKLDLLEGKVVSAASRNTANAEAFRRTDAEHAQELEALRRMLAQNAAMAERLECAEKSLGSLASRHSQEGAATTARLESLSSRLSTTEVRCASLDELRRAHDGAVQELAQLRAQQTSLRERVEAAGGLAEWHARQLEAVKDAHAESVKQLAGSHADYKKATDERIALCEQGGASLMALQKDVSSLKSERLAQDTQQHALLERVGHIELQLGDGLAKHSAAVEGLKATHARHAQDLEALVLSRHATSTERIDSLERAFGSAIEGQRKDLVASGTRLDQLHGRLVACEVSKGQHALLCERLDGLESQLGEARGKHSAELETTREAQARHERELEALRAASATHASTAEHLQSLERTLGSVSTRQSDALFKLDQLGGRVAACEERGSAIDELQRGQLASAQMAGQLQFLEKDVQEMKARQADMSKLRGVLSNVRRAWDQESLTAGATGSGGAADGRDGVHAG